MNWFCWGPKEIKDKIEQKPQGNFYPLGFRENVIEFPKVSKMKAEAQVELGLCGHTSWTLALMPTIENGKIMAVNVTIKGWPAVRSTSHFDKWSIKGDVLVRVLNRKNPENSAVFSAKNQVFASKKYLVSTIILPHFKFENDTAEVQVIVGITEIVGLFSTNFQNFAVPRDDSDLVLVVDGQKFNVHKQLMMLYSDFFRTMFSGSFKENKEEEIELTDLDLNCFHVFLQYLYMAPIKICDENVPELLEMADRFVVKKLMTECENYLLRSDMEEKKVVELANFFSLDRVVCELIGRKKTIKQLNELFPNPDALPAAASTYLVSRLYGGGQIYA